MPLISQNCAGVDFTYKIIDNTIVFSGESKKEVTEWTWSFGDNTVEARKSTVVLHEYMSELDRILTYNRTIYILWLITGWIISFAFLYSFGLGIAWVRRGFRMNDA